MTSGDQSFGPAEPRGDAGGNGPPPGEAGWPAPDGLAAAPEAEGPPAPPLPPAQEGPDRARWVAVLIMAVTLLGAVFTFLQTSATNRSSSAARRADAAAVEAAAEAVRASEHLSSLWRLWTLFAEEGAMWMSLAGSPDGTPLAPAYWSAALATASFAGFDLQGEFPAEYRGLFVETWSDVLRAGEFQKAHAAERSAWGDKASQYLAVVTVLAVALFLLGLSRTSVAAASAPLLVWSGLAVAGVASAWGLAVFLGGVARPSPEAIDAYVEGQAALSSAFSAEDLEAAEEAFTRALTLRPDYSDAYFGRGLARGTRDIYREGGPQGSEGCRDDFARVVRLDPRNPVAWNNLAAAHFWLGDLGRAIEAAERAVDLAGDDPLAGLNLALFRLVDGDLPGYEAQVSALQALLTGGEVHPARRAVAVANSLGAAYLAEQYRPGYAEAARRFREDILRLEHQISVGEEFFGTGAPAPVAARVSPLALSLSEDGTALQVAFTATGVESGQRWLYRTYRAGTLDRSLSSTPAPWPFGVPDAQGSITLSSPEGFPPGVTVRVEVFIEGNLLAAGELTP